MKVKWGKPEIDEILIISVGGTMDKDYPKLLKGYAFEFGEPAAIRVLSNIITGFRYEIVSPFKKDSQDMTQKDRITLKVMCQNAKQDKIIITHGTDTMIETAGVIGKAQIKGKAVVVTGAMRPERFSNSDAAFNLGVAVGIVMDKDEGAYVAMNGIARRHDQVKRCLNTGKFI